MKARVLALLAVALLGTACVSERTFKASRTLTEERPARHLRMPPGEMPDQPFRSEPPDRSATKPRPLATPTEARLSNGVRVLMLERHDFPSISAVLVLDRGAVAAGGVRVFRDESLSADHVGVACAGDFKPAWLLGALEKQLGNLPKHSLGAAPSLPAPVKTGRAVIVIDRPGATQSAVVIGWPGLPADDRSHAPLDVLASATAGELASRLNITVRRELGASYGVRMSATSLRSGGVVQIAAAVGTAKTRDAVKGMLVEVEKLRAEPLSDGELTAAKARTMLAFRGRLLAGRRSLARPIDLRGSSAGLHGDLQRAGRRSDGRGRTRERRAPPGPRRHAHRRRRRRLEDRCGAADP